MIPTIPTTWYVQISCGVRIRNFDDSHFAEDADKHVGRKRGMERKYVESEHKHELEVDSHNTANLEERLLFWISLTVHKL